MKTNRNIVINGIIRMANAMTEAYALLAYVMFGIAMVVMLMKDTTPVKTYHIYMKWHEEYGYWPSFACTLSNMDWICIITSFVIVVVAVITLIKMMRRIGNNWEIE